MNFCAPGVLESGTEQPPPAHKVGVLSLDLTQMQKEGASLQHEYRHIWQDPDLTAAAGLFSMFKGLSNVDQQEGAQYHYPLRNLLV